MVLGINTALQNHVKDQALKVWELQRQVYNASDTINHPPNGPFCDVKRKLKKGVVPAYLDNKENYEIQRNVPVLPKPIRYVNNNGKVVVDSGMYFIFPSNTDIRIDDLVTYHTSVYKIVSLDSDPSSFLTQAESTLVSAGSNPDN